MILAVNTKDLHEKEGVPAAGIHGVFTVQHFNNYPAVLVELGVIGAHPSPALATSAGRLRARAVSDARAVAIVPLCHERRPSPAMIAEGRVLERMGLTNAATGQRAIRWFAATTPGAWLFARVLHRLDRAAFRLSGGTRTMTAALSGLPVIMLTTTGARTGLPRTVPVLGFPVHEDIAVVAGNFGRPEDPGWCRNLRREPQARIVVDGQVRHVVADELAGQAREDVWRHCLTIYPGGTVYAARAGRVIGVFLLRADYS